MSSAKKIIITPDQRAAANPEQSVWVTANAGTGKTKVLIDRVLRLLLNGTVPDKILCLTYTKAAAAEMLSRLQQTLAQWVRMDEAQLHQTITAITGAEANDTQMTRARQLFLTVLEAPEGVRILTIHALCQSLLKRFAIEAKVSPYFRLMEGTQASILMQDARRMVFTHQRNDDLGKKLTESLNLIARHMGEEQVNELLDEIINNRKKLEPWFEEGATTQNVRDQVYTTLGIERGQTREALLADYYETMPRRITQFDEAANILTQGGSGDKERAEIFHQWLAFWKTTPTNAPDDALFMQWVNGFLTKSFTPRSSLMVKKSRDNHPDMAEFLVEEQQRIYQLTQKIFAMEAAQWSLATLTVAEALLTLYRDLKLRKGFLDYEDLIHKAHQLLGVAGIAPWILFKLDSGIDHLLIDESQDNSGTQWEIVRLIADEFFHGESARTAKRTLFVVGDEKQSIYRFQGAEPEKFAEMKHYFAQKIEQAEKPWQVVKLRESFRSTPAILQLVDKVFEHSEASDGVIEQGIAPEPHISRREFAGRVELWPLTAQEDETDDRTPWQIPSVENARATQNSESELCDYIATTIGDWLEKKRHIPARGRAIKPEDILILVRTRTSFFYRLIRTLKKYKIAVAGEDRIKLHEQIAVQDVLAVADFLLLPTDNLSLACVLKSPLFGISEDELFTLAHGRSGSLWESVKTHQPEIASVLSAWLNKVDYLRPYELLSHILEAQGGRSKLAAQLGVQVHDALDELLKLARNYEQISPPSLQGFMQEVRREEITIKREMEQAGGGVRVMTVHGSKGLQAPIVILPDTTGKPTKSDKLRWVNDTVLFAPYDAANLVRVQELKDENKQAELREYRRQLYVALTRAADELYIGGKLAKDGKKIPAGSWYDYIHSAMEDIAKPQDDGTLLLEDNFPPADAEEEKMVELKATATLPTWINSPKPVEPMPPRPLMPSRPNLPEPAQDSPLAKAAAKRGTLIHHLLEILPDIAPEKRKASAHILLKKQSIDEASRNEWIAEAMAVLNDSRFAQVFSKASQAEVPVTAKLADGQVLSGQIDRLIITDDAVLIVDYKTGKHVPASSAQLPEYYAAQMQAYVDAIAPIYPNKQVRAAILWTAIPRLMPLAITPIGA